MSGRSTGGVIRHAISMMMGTLVSRVLGLVREIVTASLFGATAGMDAFFVAFALSNMARQLLAEGALSAAFVPVFSRALGENDVERANRLARQACTLLLIGASFVVLLGILLAPLLTHLMAPGFEGAKFSLTVNLTRWLFPFLLLISLAALAMGALNSFGRFFTSALAPALSNGIFIVVILFIGRRMGVYSLIWAVLLGGFAQMMLQIWWLDKKEGVSLKPQRPDWNDRDLRRMMALFAPYALGLSLNQLNPLLTRAFGSLLTDGSVSVLNYSNRVLQLPLGLVVIAISQALLPALSAHAGDSTQFCKLLRDALKFTAYMVVPITIGTMLTAHEITHLLFYRGAFDVAAWNGTASTLFWSALGLPGMAASAVMLRGLYALEARRAPLWVAGTNVIVLFLTGLFFVRPWGVNGVAFAGTLAFTLSAAFAFWLLCGQVGRFITFARRWLLPRLLLWLSLAVVIGCYKVVLPYNPDAGLLLRLGWLALLLMICFIWYGAGTFACCREELALMVTKKEN